MRGYWTTLFIMIMTFIGTIYMQTGLKEIWELYILLFGVVLAFIVLAGIAMNKKWAPALTTIFFSAAMGNLSLVYYNTRMGDFVFVGLVFLNVIGLVAAMLREPEDFDLCCCNVAEHEPVETVIPPPPKQAKKKSAKKKIKRSKSKKK